MLKNKKINLIAIFLLGFIIGVGTYATFDLLYSDTSISSNGPVEVSDHRKLQSKELELENVVQGLDAPWAFKWLPNGDILVTQRFGQLKLIKNGELLTESISGVPQVYSAGQGGLLDVTIHPNFTQNKYIYLSYSHGNEEGNKLRILRAQLNNLTLENSQVIFEVAQSKTGSSHYGSRFEWLKDNTLIFSVGDGGNPPIEYNGELIRNQSQYLTSHFGKVIRINDDGTIPQDNPFVGRPDVRQEIYSYGHRNIQGITINSNTNQIIVSEHGSKGGDELNLVLSGKNYGWPLATYSTEYDLAGTRISQSQSIPDFEDPLAVWTPSIAPSQLVYYDSEKYENWSGNLFLAAMILRNDNSLAAYTSTPAGAILRLEIDDNSKIVSQELLRVGDVRVRSIGEGPDGYLYVLTDSTSSQNRAGNNNGALWRIEP